MKKDFPNVGVAVFIFKKGKILLGKRKSNFGEGTWSLPGGHLEFGESFEDCAKREAMEESSVSIKNVRFFQVTNDVFDDKHYVTVFMLADYESGEAKVTDFDEFYEWKWLKLDDFPENQFSILKNLLDRGYNPFNENND